MQRWKRHLRLSFDKIYYENVRLKKKIDEVKEKNQRILFTHNKYDDLQRQYEESSLERSILRANLSNSNNIKFQLEWKVIIQQSVDSYEREFDNLELRHVNSTFNLDQTLLDSTDYSDDYDRIAERRRQRWIFYMENPPAAFWNFDDLIKRIEKSNCTKEEFAKGLAIFYKRLTQVIFDEAEESDRSALTMSSYKDVNFIIPLLVTPYRKTETITRMLREWNEPEVPLTGIKTKKNYVG